MTKLPILEALIDLNEIKYIKKTKIYTFLNKYDKNKMKGLKILFNHFERFYTRIKIK